jgi:hypothetical protein
MRIAWAVERTGLDTGGDAQVHSFGVQIHTTIESVLSVVESHHGPLVLDDSTTKRNTEKG